MTPNWYDLLAVDPAASADEIRAAWKAAIADLDPTDRRFRLLNKAAAVLLDPDQRAEYDATLAAESVEAEAEDEADETETGDVAVAKVGLDKSAPVQVQEVETPEVAETPEVEPVPAEDDDRVGVPDWTVSTWLLLLVAVGAALVVAAAIALWWLRPADDAVVDAASEAERAAQRATPVIFSYDHSRLEADRDAATGHMTDEQRERYVKLFDAIIEQNAAGLLVAVESEFIASGVVRTASGREADDRVQVLVFFDQSVTNKQQTTPRTLRHYATLTMEKVDGTWLVDDVRGPVVPE